MLFLLTIFIDGPSAGISGYKTHKSLDAFCEKFSSRVGERYLVYTKDFVKNGETTCLPAYMTPFL